MSNFKIGDTVSHAYTTVNGKIVSGPIQQSTGYFWDIKFNGAINLSNCWEGNLKLISREPSQMDSLTPQEKVTVSNFKMGDVVKLTSSGTKVRIVSDSVTEGGQLCRKVQRLDDLSMWTHCEYDMTLIPAVTKFKVGDKVLVNGHSVGIIKSDRTHYGKRELEVAFDNGAVGDYYEENLTILSSQEMTMKYEFKVDDKVRIKATGDVGKITVELKYQEEKYHEWTFGVFVNGNFRVFRESEIEIVPEESATMKKQLKIGDKVQVQGMGKIGIIMDKSVNGGGAWKVFFDPCVGTREYWEGCLTLIPSEEDIPDAEVIEDEVKAKFKPGDCVTTTKDEDKDHSGVIQGGPFADKEDLWWVVLWDDNELQFVSDTHTIFVSDLKRRQRQERREKLIAELAQLEIEESEEAKDSQ